VVVEAGAIVVRVGDDVVVVNVVAEGGGANDWHTSTESPQIKKMRTE